MNSKNLQYHVTYGDSKKVIQVADSEQVFSKIVETFKIHRTMFTLQYFNTEFGDWVDVDNIEDIPRSCKLLVKIISSEHAKYLESSVKTPENRGAPPPGVADLVFLPLPKSISLEPSTVEAAEAQLPSRNSTTALSKTPTVHQKQFNGVHLPEVSNTQQQQDLGTLEVEPPPCDQLSTHCAEAALSPIVKSRETDRSSVQSPVHLEREIQKVPKNGNSSSSWIATYELPPLPLHILERIHILEKDEVLESRYRREIVRILFNSMICHVKYPTSQQYVFVCCMLVTKYPTLRDNYSRNGVHHMSWHRGLCGKYKEYRRVAVVDDKQREMRRKHGRPKKPQDVVDVDLVESPRCKDPRWQPVVSIAKCKKYKDRPSVKPLLMKLKREMKKASPSDEVICDILERTLMYRRIEIAKGKQTVDIMKDFPCLLHSKWILEEMKIVMKVDLMKEIEAGDVDKMVKLKRLVLYHWKKLSNRTKKLIALADGFYISAVADILNVPEFITDGKNKKHPYPTVVFECLESVYVTVDGFKVIGIDDIKTALATLIASYWVFSIEFPKSQQKFLILMAKYVFGIPGLEYPNSLVRILNML